MDEAIRPSTQSAPPVGLRPTTWSENFRALPADEVAVLDHDQTWTRRELLEYAAGMADWLDAAGVAAGAVPALLGSQATSFALFVGALGSGRHLAPLGVKLAAPELTSALQRLGGDVLLADEQFASTACDIATATGKRVVVVPVGSRSRSHRPLDFDQAAGDPCFILHTSGTTGLPKPVPWRQGQMGARLHVMEVLDLKAGCTYASASPFHHAAGLGNFALTMETGAAVASMSAFNVETWATVRERGITHALLVPAMIEILLEAGALRDGDVRVLHYGSSPIHPQTLAHLVEDMPGIELVQMYGQTEGTPITCLTPADHRAAARGRPHLRLSVGRPVANLEVRIESPNARGEGEIVCRGPHLFMPGADGWLRTGDVGVFDDDGYLYIRGRRNDMILRSGEKVYPVEVEQALTEHRAVAEAAVIGVPDRIHGQRLRAYLVLATPFSSAEPEALISELVRHARVRLAGFKVPAEWRFVDALPRSSTGKVQRNVLANSVDSE